MEKKSIGFTGSRNGMTEDQLRVFEFMLKQLSEQDFGIFYHGDCIGADFMAAKIAEVIGMYTVSLPCKIKNMRAHHKSNRIMKPDDPIRRNHAIVNQCNLMIATPKEDYNVYRSGTWATMRYAQKVGRHLIIIWPDGSIKEDV